MRSLLAGRRPRARACLPAWGVLLTLSAVAGATVVTGPPQPYCDIENSYGASMAVLGGRHLVVGSAGEFCDFVEALDPGTGDTVWSLYDLDDTNFGSLVATIGRDVLVARLGESAPEVLRVEPAAAVVRAMYEAPPPVSSIAALVAVNQRVALLDIGSAPGAGGIHMFDARTGALLRTVPNPEPERWLRPVLSRVGRRLVISHAGVGNLDGIVSIVDPETGAVDAVVGSPEAGDSFGSAIAADGAVIAVGAPGASGGRGAVYLFDRRGRLRQTIVPDDPNAGCFGDAVAVRRDAVLVGAPCTSLEGGEEGAAYLYSARNGALIGSYPGRDEDGRLGLDVALLRTAVALAGRGPDTADNGIVRLVPR